MDLREAELGKKPDNDDYVFCNRDGTPVGSFKKSFESLLKAAGVETDSHGNRRTIYSLRHTYATFRLQEGVHQFILAKNMGTSTAMLEKHYGHTSNVASAAELTKGGTFKGDKKAKAVDWL
jgi:integrase